jgi:dihydrofolate reductase
MAENDKSITLIAAMAANRAIGINGGMPWHLPGELQHFKQVTMGKPIVMGRRTWQSIGQVLPGRQNIVVSRDRAFCAPGCAVCGSLPQALAVAEGREVMVIGGGELYRQALPLASRMILTLVDCEPAADTWFPAWDAAEWVMVAQREVAASEQNPLTYRVQEWNRS